MPVFARDILMGGPGTLGLLMACSGTGALVGAVYLAARKSILGLGRWIVYGSSLFGCAIIAFSLSRVVWLSAALLLVSGFGMIIQMASSNTILQTIVEEDKRGRVMSLFALAIMGTSPLGSLFAGFLGEKIGVVYTLIISGFICIAGALLFAGRLPEIREQVRPIYRSMGIGRPIDSGRTAPES
jgi:MFS family permease